MALQAKVKMEWEPCLKNADAGIELSSAPSSYWILKKNLKFQLVIKIHLTERKDFL